MDPDMNVNYYDYVEEDDDSVEVPEMVYTDIVADDDNENQVNLAKTSTEAPPVQIVGKENKIKKESKPDTVPINCELTDLTNKNKQIYPSCFHNKKFSNTDLPSTNPSFFTSPIGVSESSKADYHKSILFQIAILDNCDDYLSENLFVFEEHYRENVLDEKLYWHVVYKPECLVEGVKCTPNSLNEEYRRNLNEQKKGNSNNYKSNSYPSKNSLNENNKLEIPENNNDDDDYSDSDYNSRDMENEIENPGFDFTRIINADKLDEKLENYFMLSNDKYTSDVTSVIEEMCQKLGFIDMVVKPSDARITFLGCQNKPEQDGNNKIIQNNSDNNNNNDRNLTNLKTNINNNDGHALRLPLEIYFNQADITTYQGSDLIFQKQEFWQDLNLEYDERIVQFTPGQARIINKNDVILNSKIYDPEKAKNLAKANAASSFSWLAMSIVTIILLLIIFIFFSFKNNKHRNFYRFIRNHSLTQKIFPCVRPLDDVSDEIDNEYGVPLRSVNGPNSIQDGVNGQNGSNFQRQFSGNNIRLDSESDVRFTGLNRMENVYEARTIVAGAPNQMGYSGTSIGVLGWFFERLGLVVFLVNYFFF